jgi:hypothetical protein
VDNRREQTQCKKQKKREKHFNKDRSKKEPPPLRGGFLFCAKPLVRDAKDAKAQFKRQMSKFIRQLTANLKHNVYYNWVEASIDAVFSWDEMYGTAPYSVC